MPDTLHNVQHQVKKDIAHRALVSLQAANNDATMRLADIRNARGLSQKALGEMIGKDASTIQRAEVMHHSAKLTTYRDCARALGVSLAELFVGSDAEAVLIRAFRAAGDGPRQMLLGMAEKAATLPQSPAGEATPSGVVPDHER